MDATEYLTLDDIVALHGAIVERTGQPPSPLIDSGKLESAIARPRNSAAYEGADLVHQAILLAVGISQSQAFLDGNKRAAFAAADVFLRINGKAFSGDPLEIAKRLEGVAEIQGNAARDEEADRFEAWARGQIRDLEPPADYLALGART